MNNIIVGSSSQIYKNIADPTDICLSSGRNWKDDIELLENIVAKNQRVRIINFAAPTVQAVNFTNSRKGVTDNLRLIEKLSSKFKVEEIVQIGSVAELEMSFRLNQTKTPKDNVRFSLTLDLLTERPYSYWKIYQYEELKKLSFEKNIAFRHCALPFIDFKTHKNNADYYLPDGKPIFHPSKKFTTIGVSSLRGYIIQNQPMFKQNKTIKQLTNKTILTSTKSNIVNFANSFIYLGVLVFWPKSSRREKILNSLSFLRMI